LNLVAGWIDTVTIKRDATLSAHECKRPHAGDDVRLTSEGVRLAALAVESDRHRARAITFAKRKPSLVARPFVLSAARRKARTEISPACGQSNNGN
jgi:hypothetical protein